MFTRLLFLFINLISFTSNYCNAFQVEGISYKILDDTLRIDPRDKYLEINFQISNSTDTDFILHGFSDIRPGILLEIDGIKKGGVIGNISLFERFGKQEVAGLVLHDDDFKYFGVEEVQDFVILKHQSSIIMNRKVDLKPFSLEPWKYKFSLIYSSDIDEENGLSEKEISVEEKKYGAIFFKGWIQSNTVPLIVRYVP